MRSRCLIQYVNPKWLQTGIFFGVLVGTKSTTRSRADGGTPLVQIWPSLDWVVTIGLEMKCNLAQLHCCCCSTVTNEEEGGQGVEFGVPFVTHLKKTWDKERKLSRWRIRTRHGVTNVGINVSTTKSWSQRTPLHVQLITCYVLPSLLSLESYIVTQHAMACLSVVPYRHTTTQPLGWLLWDFV